jgi:anti-anti-sigma regulatory factor
MKRTSTAALSKEIYHKIYRLHKRNVAPQIIAATLHLPMDAVLNIVTRLASSDSTDGHSLSSDGPAPAPAPKAADSYVDVYLLARSRYVTLDIGGMITAQNVAHLESEFARILASAWKAVALKMSDIREIDDAGVDALVKFFDEFVGRSRYAAILDPSDIVEAIIRKRDLGDIIPIFGTERSFEENAFNPDANKLARKRRAARA